MKFAFYCVLCAVATMVVLPVVAYLVAKLGAAGYFRAKRRDQEQNTNQHKQNE